LPDAKIRRSVPMRLLACRTRATVLDTYKVTTLFTWCPPIAAIYVTPLGENGTMPPCPAKLTLWASNFASQTNSNFNKALCPAFSLKPNSIPAHFCDQRLRHAFRRN